AIVAVVVSLALVAGSQARRANRTAKAEARQREIAEAQRLDARRKLYAAQMQLAQQSWNEGSARRTLALLAPWRPEPGEEDLRGFEWRHLWHLCHTDDAFFTFHG